METIKDLIRIRLQKRCRVGLLSAGALDPLRDGSMKATPALVFYSRMQSRSKDNDEAGSRLICR